MSSVVTKNSHESVFPAIHETTRKVSELNICIPYSWSIHAYGDIFDMYAARALDMLSYYAHLRIRFGSEGFIEHFLPNRNEE